MKTWKKLIATLLLNAMILSSVGFINVSAASTNSGELHETIGDWAYTYTLTDNNEAKIEKCEYNGTALCKLELPSRINGYSVVRIDDICRNNPYVTEIVIPDGIKSIFNSVTNVASISNCSELEKIFISKSVETVLNFVDSCPKLDCIEVDAKNNIYDSRDSCNAVIRKSDNTLIAGCDHTIIPDSVKNIGPWAFSGCNGIEMIDLPENIESIGNYAFYGCNALEKVCLPISVTDIGDYAFDDLFKGVMLCDEENVCVQEYAQKHGYKYSIGGLKEKKMGDPFAYICKPSPGYKGSQVKVLSMAESEKFVGVTKVRVIFKCAADVSFNEFANINVIANIAATENYQQFKGDGGYVSGKVCSVEFPLKTVIKAGDSIEIIMSTDSWDGAKGDYVYAIKAIEFLDGSNRVLGTYIDQDVFRENLAVAIKEAEGIDASAYTDESVKKLADALVVAKALKEDAPAEEMKKALDALNEVIGNLVKKEGSGDDKPSPSPSSRPTASPSASPTAEPSRVPLPSPSAIPTETVRPTASPTVNPPVHTIMPRKPQSIVASSYVKTYGGKAFYINAKTNGDGRLFYGGANRKVAVVSQNGKVTIKGYGKSTVKIMASGTDRYQSAVKKIAITVIPKKAVISSLSSRRKGQIVCRVRKQKKVTGYEFMIGTLSGKRYSAKTKKLVFKTRFASKTKYLVRVRAFKKMGGKTYKGAWSKKKLFKTK